MPLPTEDAIVHLDSTGRVQTVANYLLGTAARASEAGAKFQSSDWAKAAGLWHDLGKYRPAFQRMIRAAAGESVSLEGTPSSKVDHSSVGAAHAQGFKVETSGETDRIGVEVSGLWLVAEQWMGSEEARPDGGPKVLG